VLLTRALNLHRNSIMSDDLLAQQEYIYEPEYKGKRTSGSTGSILFNFIRQIRIGMDLTSVTAPSFILRSQSQLEVQAIVVQPTVHLAKLSETPQPEKRMSLVAQWALHALSALPQQGIENLKPYNPILGEQFHCHWNHEDGSVTKFLAEQVSHHPPISATIMKNEAMGITYNSTQLIHVYFRGNYVESDMSGSHVLEFQQPGSDIVERYVFTYPLIVARGLFFGDTYVELGDKLIITCNETKTRTEIKFSGGNKLDGAVTLDGRKIYRYKGKLFESVDIKDKRTNQVEKFVNSEVKTTYPIIRKVDEQEPNESRRVWHNVTFALKDGELETASQQKVVIEERQRQIAKERTTPYVPAHFAKKEGTDGEVYQFTSTQL
jgi:hypothetical protein